MRAVVGGIEPLVGDVDLVGQRQVAESVVVVIHLADVGVHRAVEQDDARKFLVFGDGERRRYVGLGTQLVVEVEVHEQALVVRGLAVLEVDLARNGLVARRYGRHAFRHLNRVEPHAGRIAQPVGSAQTAHDGTVLVEDLGVGTRQAEHLDLPCARDGVAVPHGHRGRVLETLGQVAAGHLAKARERNHLVLDDAVALDEIAAQVTLDHDILQRHALGLQREIDTLHTACDAQRVILVSQVGGNELVVTLHPVEQECPVGIGARTDRSALPVDRGAHQRLVVGVADCAPQILCAEGAAHGKGRNR